MKKINSPLPESSICIYEWNAWTGFMLPFIFPGATRIRARICEENDQILQSLPPALDYFIFQVNLTKTNHFFVNIDELIASLASRKITLLNHHISDISKTNIQAVCRSLGLLTTLAFPEGDPEEMLIVKTNLNCGGLPENKLLPAEGRLLKISRSVFSGFNYPVISRKKIPVEVWNSEDYVVEKFISNKNHLFYRAYKLFDRLVISEVTDPNPIKKMPEGIQRTNTFCDMGKLTLHSSGSEKLFPLLKALTMFCNRIGLDFGALDIVRSEEGDFYIIDVNVTPYWGGTGHPAIISYLSGI